MPSVCSTNAKSRVTAAQRDCISGKRTCHRSGIVFYKGAHRIGVIAIQRQRAELFICCIVEKRHVEHKRTFQITRSSAKVPKGQSAKGSGSKRRGDVHHRPSAQKISALPFFDRINIGRNITLSTIRDAPMQPWRHPINTQFLLDFYRGYSTSSNPSSI